MKNQTDYSKIHYQQIQPSYGLMFVHFVTAVALFLAADTIVASIFSVWTLTFFVHFSVLFVFVYDGEYVIINYGILGLQSTLILDEVVSLKEVKNGFIDKLKLQNITTSFLFELTGAKTFEFTIKDGRKYRIAIGKPGDFFRALNRRKQKFDINVV